MTLCLYLTDTYHNNIDNNDNDDNNDDDDNESQTISQSINWK